MQAETLIQPLAEEYLKTRTNESFVKLYNRIIPGIKHFVWETSMSYIDKDTLEDIISRTFYKAIINIEQYDYTRANFSTWLFAIARNEVFNELRSIKNKVMIEGMFTSDDYDIIEHDVAYINNVIDKDKYEVKFRDIIQEKEIYKKRRNLLASIFWEIENTLSPLYSNILIDREVYKMSYSDISSKYLLPINTVKSRIRIGRQLVRESLKPDILILKKEVMEELYG